MPLLTQCLLIDPEHSRQGQEPHVKAAIQRDAAGCLLQLALFGEQGRHMLQGSAATLGALRHLAHDALSEEAIAGGETVIKWQSSSKRA